MPTPEPSGVAATRSPAPTHAANALATLTVDDRPVVELLSVFFEPVPVSTVVRALGKIG